MDKINLKDLCPEEATITLSGREHVLRKLNLEDESWLIETFGDKLETILKEINMVEISKIVFRLIKDKSYFASHTFTEMDEMGVETTRTIGGVKLLYSQISGINEKLAVYKALLTTIGVSRPILSQLGIEEGPAEKKSQQTKQTGARSSTRSRVSTATRSSKSKR